MTFSNLCNEIFWKSTNDYHVTDSVDAQMNNPYELKLYLLIRMYIVTVQAVDIDILGQMDIRAIVYMFRIGMIVHMLVSMVCYRWEIRKRG